MCEMGAVRLGKIALRWCTTCNIPIIELEKCGTCGGQTEPMKITPPGDFRPAFDFDIGQIRSTVDCQFGDGCGEILLPKDKVVVLNKCPGVDRMDEVIVDGQVVGTHVFEPGKGQRFVIRTEGALFIEPHVTRSWLEVHEGAIPSMRKGASAMAVGVMEADENIKVGDEVIVFDSQRNVIATGRARMSGSDMLELERGPAIKTRWHSDPKGTARFPGGQTWDDAVQANLPKLEADVARAVRKINTTVERIGKELAVSYSGGKDSLATLLLVLEAGIKPKVIFMDTGIEFPETLANISETVEKHGLELLVEDAGNAFFDAAEHFGPPAKDFRWCCKTCKLGPTSRLIKKHFPDGVLSFIGQRQYESENRYQKGGIWVNPWVPGQIGMSPIQKWPALEVWLYIFSKGEEYNPLYEKGFERIGCWLCPSADMAEHAEIEKYEPKARDWIKFLSQYAEKHDLPPEWVDMGLWRWKHLPKGIRDFLEIQQRQDIIDKLDAFATRERDAPEIDESGAERISQLSKITGGEETEEIKRKALFCVGCGICVSRCPEDALSLSEGRVMLDEERCVSCGKCLHPCPVVDYGLR